FALLIERFSRHPQFTLNLTFFNRKQYHPDVREIIGDFTSVLLVDFDVVREGSIKELIEQTQERLWERLAHSEINGVELVREMGRGDSLNSQPAMPIVFTSMLGVSLDGKDISQALSSFLGDPVYMFTQTPQVWLDHQVMEVENELVYNWFEMEGVLQHGLAARMFAEYTQLLQTFASDPTSMREISSWPLREDMAENLDSDHSSLTKVDGQQVNLLHLEKTLRTHPMIRRVQVELVKEETREVLTVHAVARDVESPSVPTDPIDTASLPSLSQDDIFEVESTWRHLEERALFGICQTLMRHDLFIIEGRTWALDEVCSMLQALPRYERLVQQWLAMLQEKGWLRRNGTLYECVRSLHTLSAPESLDLQGSWSQHLLQYLEASNARHDAMLRGDHSPLQILFDEHKHVARTLYSDNPAMHFLNSSAAKLVEQLTCSSDRLRVLEVGGGTGATTRHLLPILASRLLSYHFTDVSTLFLDDAKEQFKEYPELSYGLFDINQPIDFSMHPAEGYDLIVAANVLHDATHVVRSLRRLRRLLAPNGHLLMIEATERDSVFQLATVGFIEGLSGFQDFRTLDNKPMLDLPMWRTALKRAGFSLDFAWPSDAPSPIKQHMLVARPLFNARLDFDAIQEYLGRNTSIPAIELSFQQFEALPHPSRRISPPQSTFQPPLPASPPLPDGLSFIHDTIRSVWEALLPGRQIRGDTDFFLSGGDSLIATRMVAALARQGFVDASLQKLYANPVLEDFCKTLTMPSGRGGDNPVLLANGTETEPVYLFHTSDGEVTGYLKLAKRLDRPVYGLHAPQAFNRKTMRDLTADYVEALRQHHDQSAPYILAGWSYGAFLAVEAARQLIDSGATVKLILLDPVCRADFEYEDRVGLLKLLGDGPGGLSLPEKFELLSPSDQLEILRSQAIDSGLLPSSTDIDQIGKWVDRTDYLFSLLKNHHSPLQLQAPSLWITATRRPARWRPAEFEWSRWDENAHHMSIQADHWELVMTDTHAIQTANAINNWLKRDGRNE
ncbi:MAG TPA: alpha/beta fold hydrolase, partial [Edaphobacter sp.]|nr:alpha/beta fold hydrolase [Edaphobacter sp.]